MNSLLVGLGPYLSNWNLFLPGLTLQELLQLEEDVKLLEEMYPQGEKVTSLTCCF